MSLAISMGSAANGRGLCDRVFQFCKITCPKIGKSLHDENIPIIIKIEKLKLLALDFPISET